MQTPSNPSFRDSVDLQVDLLQAGRPLEAFDRFFAADGVMYANDEVFARGAEEGRRKQEPFISSAKSMTGSIVELSISDTDEICTFRNRTSFVTHDDVAHQIDGLCWQRWCDGRIVEERYYDGERMKRVISEGLLLKPDMLGK